MSPSGESKISQALRQDACQYLYVTVSQRTKVPIKYIFQASLADASVHEFPRHLRDHLVMEAVTIARWNMMPAFLFKEFSQEHFSDRTGWKRTTSSADSWSHTQRTRSSSTLPPATPLWLKKTLEFRACSRYSRYFLGLSHSSFRKECLAIFFCKYDNQQWCMFAGWKGRGNATDIRGNVATLLLAKRSLPFNDGNKGIPPK